MAGRLFEPGEARQGIAPGALPPEKGEPRYLGRLQIPGPGRQQKPVDGVLAALFGSHPVAVGYGHPLLGLGAALEGGSQKPAEGLAIVFGNPLARGVDVSKEDLKLRIAGRGQRLKPPHGPGGVLGDAVPVQHGQAHLLFGGQLPGPEI
jgi:hypothetical protein